MAGQLNYIAAAIMQSYEDRFQNDPAYLCEKRRMLESHESKWLSISALAGLDGTSRNLVAAQLGVSRLDLDALIRV